MKFDPLTSCLFLVAVFASLAADACSAQALQWKLAVDDQFEVEFEQTSATNTDVANRTPGAVPRKTTTKVSTLLKMDWIVVERDSKQNAVIEQSISMIRLTVSNPAMPNSSLEFDTSSTEIISAASQALLDQVKPLIGLKFIVTMSPRGEIVSVSTPEPTQTALRKLPGSLQLQALFSESGIKELLGAAAVVLPDETLKTDQSWEKKNAVSTAFGEFDRVRKYTYLGDEKESGRDVAVFDIKTSLDKITPSADDSSPTLSDFSESGKTRFDIEAGYFRTCRVTSLTSTEMNYREKKIATTVDNSIEMTINKK